MRLGPAGPDRPLLVAVVAMLAALAATSARPETAEGFDARAARKVYRQHCEECHGRSGRGDGERARSLGFHPRDFSLGAFKCRCTPNGALPSDGDLTRTITEGLAGSPMTGFGDKLSADEVRLAIGFVKSLTPRFESDGAPACMELGDEAAASAASADDGGSLYRMLGCWKCHGPAGRGDGPSSESLVDDWGHAIRVPDFVRSGKLKCGAEPLDIYRTLHTGMNGSPMPSFTAAFAFAMEDLVNAAAPPGVFADDVVAADRAWLARQPPRAELQGASSDRLHALVERRTWDLVRYVRLLLERRPEPSP